MTPQALLLAETMTEAHHTLGRLAEFTEWWQWLLLIVGSIAVIALIVVMYYFDSRELSAGISTTLVVLRVLAFIGLLVFFLNFEKRTERLIVKNSRVLMLADTSLSMGLRDASKSTPQSRGEAIAAELKKGELLKELRRQHDVVVYRFDEEDRPSEIASFTKTTAAEEDGTTLLNSPIGNLFLARALAIAAGGVLFGSLLLGLIYYAFRSQPSVAGVASWLMFLCVMLFVGSAITLAIGHLQTPSLGLLQVFGLQSVEPPKPTEAELAASEETSEENQKLEINDVDWDAALLPKGAKTRVTDSIRYLINKERGGTVAGIVLITDGGHNFGSEPKIAIRAANDAEIPLFAIGLGSKTTPVNVAVVDVEAPAKLYPKDEFTVSGLLRANGLEGRTVTVSLLANREGEEGELVEDERRVKLGGDGEKTAVRFKLDPKGDGDIGRWTYKVRVKSPDEDSEPRDDASTATVEVVGQQNRVLLLAGGPTREFRFLRNQLYRDPDTWLGVLLQTAQDGVSQESDLLLENFPETEDELFEYDCIVAFDPDWSDLNDDQVRLLERFLAEKAGGLVVVAGPIYTPIWSNRRKGDFASDTIKGLYPVVFFHAGAANLRLGRFGGDEAWPIEFSRDGRESEHLWLTDDSLTSEQAWEDFEGVFGYYEVREPKKGAKVLARFSDPETALGGVQPIYLASHMYGAGRVFFQASGEMWRVRAVDDTYFEQYYTKVIRWASQGRLLRDSSRGVLLVDEDRVLVGEHVVVTAILQDAQHNPLIQDAVAAMITLPDGSRKPLALKQVKDGARAGMYATDFVASQEGSFEVQLQVPQSINEEDILSVAVRARVPDLEVEKPQRDDTLLSQLALETGGEYYIGFDTAMNRGRGDVAIHTRIASKERRAWLPGAPDRAFRHTLMLWLLGLICGVLCLEWSIRRLSRLA